MAQDWEHLREPDLVHVLITARDESSAYRVFDALVDRFPAVNPPALRPALPGRAPSGARTEEDRPAEDNGLYADKSC